MVENTTYYRPEGGSGIYNKVCSIILWNLIMDYNLFFDDSDCVRIGENVRLNRQGEYYKVTLFKIVNNVKRLIFDFVMRC